MKWANFVKECVVPTANVENVAKLMWPAEVETIYYASYAEAEQSSPRWLKANMSLRKKGCPRLPRWSV